MDLLAALQALSALSNQMTYEDVVEAKETLLATEEAMEKLFSLCDNLGLNNSDSLLQLIASYETVKNEIMECFDEKGA